ncbi:Bax inhibitor-1/YccA family protein [soil metagenome]
MATGNPALNEKYFQQEASTGERTSVMTVQGAAIKTMVLTAILVAAAAVSWGIVFPHGISSPSGMTTAAGKVIPPEVNHTAMVGFLAGGSIVALILGLIMCFRPKAAPVCAPLYAVSEGLALGAISGVYAVGAYPGIVMQAGMLTIGVLVSMLTLYATRLIVVTDKLRTGIMAATMGIMLVYLASMVLRMFNVGIPYIHDGGMIGIGFSIVVVIIAALNLVLDFDTIEAGAHFRAPKYMEWYSAYGLLVTLVWLYLEILRLLAKLQSNRD